MTIAHSRPNRQESYNLNNKLDFAEQKPTWSDNYTPFVCIKDIQILAHLVQQVVLKGK